MIALISDTHENEAAIQKAVSVIRSRKPEFTVHLGDIISPLDEPWEALGGPGREP